jgi:hypothetical protein
MERRSISTIAIAPCNFIATWTKKRVVFPLFLMCSCAPVLAQNIEVYVAYADNTTNPAFFPNPWNGSPNTTFLGGYAGPGWNTGAILLRNIGTSGVTLNKGTNVNGFGNGATFELWDGSIGGGFAIPPGGQVILAQTAATGPNASNFDTGDASANSGQPPVATPNVNLVLNGVPATYIDSAQVLNSAGYVRGALQHNASVQWRLIGTTGPYLPGGTGVNPPAVTTYHNDNSRTGLNSAETTLNQSNVTAATFGKLFSYPVVGNVAAQPLFVPNVWINRALHNVVVVVTDQNYVYAFDAEQYVSGLPLWTPLSLGAVGGGGFPGVSTPVIDPTTNTLYIVTKQQPNQPATQACRNLPANVMAVAMLNAIDLSSGAQKFSGPQCVGGSYFGVGEGAAIRCFEGPQPLVTNPLIRCLHRYGILTFDESSLSQRPALLLSNGYVYVAFGANGDSPPYHGWLFAYNASNLNLAPDIFVTTPNASSQPQSQFPGGTCHNNPVPAGAGIWMEGAGAAADATHLYLTTGNGTYDTSSDYGDTILKLNSATGNGVLSVNDWFTPSNQQTLQCNDSDFGASGPMLIPGTNPELLVQVSKLGLIYLINTASMGKFTAGCSSQPGPPCESSVIEVVQSQLSSQTGCSNPGNPCWMMDSGAPAYSSSSNYVYVKAQNDALKGFAFNSLATPPLATTTTTSSQATTPSLATPSVSLDSKNATPSATEIVWTIEPDTNSNAELRAYWNAQTGASQSLNVLYDSSAQPKDVPGTYAGQGIAVAPTIAAGKVFVATQNGVAVYGGNFSASNIPSATLTVNVTKPVGAPGIDVLIDGVLPCSAQAPPPGQPCQPLTNLANGAAVGPVTLMPGAHTVSVTAALGQSLSRYKTSISGSCSGSGNVTLSSSGAATCSATLTQIPAPPPPCRYGIKPCIPFLPRCPQGLTFCLTRIGIGDEQVYACTRPELCSQP